MPGETFKTLVAPYVADPPADMGGAMDMGTNSGGGDMDPGTDPGATMDPAPEDPTGAPSDDVGTPEGEDGCASVGVAKKPMKLDFFSIAILGLLCRLAGIRRRKP